MSNTLWIWHWSPSSRSYLDHECTRHIVSWWYTYVPNMVSQCQTIKKLWAGKKFAQTNGRTHIEVLVIKITCELQKYITYLWVALLCPWSVGWLRNWNCEIQSPRFMWCTVYSCGLHHLFCKLYKGCINFTYIFWVNNILLYISLKS